MREALIRGAIFALFGVAPVFITAALSCAQQATGTPSVYKVTLKQLEFSFDSGATFTTVKTADLEIDLASVTAGAVAATYVTAAEILILINSGVLDPTKTYNRIRATISCTIKLKGRVACPSPAICPAPTTFFTTSPPTTPASTSAAAEAEGSYTIPTPPCSAAGTLSDTGSVGFDLQGGHMDVSFNVAGGIRLDAAPAAAALSPNTVSVTYTFVP